MINKSALKNTFVCLITGAAFLIAIAACLAFKLPYANGAYFAALSLLLAVSASREVLASTLLGLFSGAGVFVLCLVYGVVFPCPTVGGIIITFDNAGIAFALLISLVPVTAGCVVASLTARLLGLFKGLNKIIITVISGLVGSCAVYGASVALSALFLFEWFTPTQESRYALMLQRRLLLLACGAFVLCLAFGIISEVLSRRRSHTIDVEFEEKIPDLEPGSELLPYKKIPIKMLMSENYFNYDDFVYNPDRMKPFSGVKLVIFDMDGLIFDTERLSYRALKYALREQRADITEAEYASVTGGSREFFAELMARLAPEADIEQILKIRNEHFDTQIRNYGVPLKKGFAELADHLENREIRMAIGTSTFSGTAAPLLTRAGILSLFSTVVYGDEVERRKPSPDIYLEVLRREGLPAEAAVVLEDSKNGIMSAVEAGIRVIMVPDMTPPTGELTSHCAAVCDDLAQITKLI